MSATSTTSRNKTLIFIIAALLLTNIAVLAYFLWIKKPGPKYNARDRSGMIEKLQKEVGFNEQQIAQYKQLKDQQREMIHPMFDEMRKAKDSLFRLMGDTTVSDSVISKAADAIAQKQRALDLQTFNHIRKVRALCTTSEQRVKYDSMVLKMFRKMGRPPVKRTEADKKETKP